MDDREKIARVICASRGCHPVTHFKSYGEPGVTESWKTFLPFADAALDALSRPLTPFEAMK